MENIIQFREQVGSLQSKWLAEFTNKGNEKRILQTFQGLIQSASSDQNQVINNMIGFDRRISNENLGIYDNMIDISREIGNVQRWISELQLYEDRIADGIGRSFYREEIEDRTAKISNSLPRLATRIEAIQQTIANIVPRLNHIHANLSQFQLTLQNLGQQLIYSLNRDVHQFWP